MPRELIFGVVDNAHAAPVFVGHDDPYPWPQQADMFMPPSYGNIVGDGLTATQIEALVKFSQDRMTAEFHGFGAAQQLEITWDFMLPFEYGGWQPNDALVVPYWSTGAGNNGMRVIVRDSHRTVVLTTAKVNATTRTLYKVTGAALAPGIFLPRTLLLVTVRITVDEGHIFYIGSLAVGFKRMYRSERSKVPNRL